MTNRLNPYRRPNLCLGIFSSGLVCALLLSGATQVQTSSPSMQPPGGTIRRELFMPSPKPGTAVLANTYYTRPKGSELISMHELMSRSDTTDVAFFRFSKDNGRTWTAGEEIRTEERRPQGKLRRMLRGACVDPHTGRFLRFRIEGVLPTDDPLEGMKQWVVFYSASMDGGLTWYLDEQIIQKGAAFSPTHPMPGVQTGRTCVMIGDAASGPLILDDGTILLPVIITPAGPDGHYYNPGGGYTYTDAAVLHGRWAANGRHLEWELSELVKADPELSTRGMDEPALAELADGRLLMVLRGSNDKKPALPSRRWVAYSSDRGRTWTKPAPWTYEGGGDFFSPSSCSQLLTHSSGRIFWLGNITENNPSGNRPRYPFVVGEVDRRTGLLRRESVRIVDDRRPGDSLDLSLSNFTAREDRASGEIVLHLSRLFQNSKSEMRDWTSDAYVYHIPINEADLGAKPQPIADRAATSYSPTHPH